MKGSTFKRCGCRDGAGKPLGGSCPRLRSKNHGTWYYKAELPMGPKGERRIKRRGGFVTRQDADVALTDLLDRVNKRTHIDPGRQPVGGYFEQWLAGKAQLRSTTARSYAEHVTLYLTPVLGHLRLADLSVTDIEELYEAMRQLGRTKAGASSSPELAQLLAARSSPELARPLSAARIRRVHATLRSALNSAVKRRLIPFNPALYVELAQAGRPKALLWTGERTDAWRAWEAKTSAAATAVQTAAHRFKIAERRARQHPADGHAAASCAKLGGALVAAKAGLAQITTTYQPPKVAVWTPEQTGRFLDSAVSDRLYAMYHLIAFRGLRRGEAVGASWTNANLERAELTICWQILQLGYDTVGATPKSGSEGTIALDKQTVAVLRAHRAQQDADRQAWGPAWVQTGLMFTKENGAALHPEYVSRHFSWFGRKRWPAPYPAPRSEARRSHTRPGQRRGSEGCLGNAPALLDHHHRRHLHQRPTRGVTSSGGSRRGARAEGHVARQHPPAGSSGHGSSGPTSVPHGPKSDSGPPLRGEKGQVGRGAPPGT